MNWKTDRRTISLDKPLVMGILNVTPDSFSDGGDFTDLDSALRHAEKMISAGAAIIDIGGESTRPGGAGVSEAEEISRTIPIIEKIGSTFNVPISIDTSKSNVARAALNAGAEIINDISGLRFDAEMATIAADTSCGLILMHSIGDFETMHTAPKPVDVITEVITGLEDTIRSAQTAGVADDRIVLDVGIGFGKTAEQSFRLVGRMDEIIFKFSGFPFLVGASRKSFLKLAAGKTGPKDRMAAGLAAAVVSVAKGARIIRTHDVAETVQALKFLEVLQDDQ